VYVRNSLKFAEDRDMTFEEFCEYFIADAVLNDYEKQAMLIILECLNVKDADGRYECIPCYDGVYV
jgi:hypothetical protein